MKYIDAEKLIAEIEKLDDVYRTLRVNGTTQEAKEADLVVHVLHGISNFIDSLQQERQERQEVDLEKETESWILHECGPSDFNPFADHWCADDIMATARHFYELGKNSK